MISIRDLTFAYKNANKLFDHLDLELSPGMIYGLLGINGAGKTTLIKLLLGLRYRQNGEISVMGHDPGSRSPQFLRDTFLISEDIYKPEISLKDFVTMYGSYYPRFDLNLFFELLGRFKVSRKSFNAVLSMGQRKKAMIAFALATNTRLLVMDEPTNGLDIPSKKEFRKMMSEHITDDRIFLVSTHQIRDLHSLLDSVIIVERGKIIFHQGMSSISKKIKFVITPKVPDWDDLLYVEKIPGGYLALSTRDDRPSYEVDIEILFNAILSDPGKYVNLFYSSPHA